jgi:minichromosome maintenance protein 10
MGAIASKSKTKNSSNGKPFSVIKLTDLQGNFLSVFLFGSAFQEHWMESEGTLVTLFDSKVSDAIHNAPLSPFTTSFAIQLTACSLGLSVFLQVRAEDDGSKSLSITDGSQLLKVGKAAEFGFCKGTCKDGTPCRMAINVRDCEWCQYHMGEALKR